MDKIEASQLIRNTRAWFMENAGEDAVYGAVLDAFDLDEFNGEAFAIPVPFTHLLEHPLMQGKNIKGLDSQIRRMQDKMDGDQFPLRTSIYLKSVKGYCYLILGTEEVSVVRLKKEDGGLENVTLSFDDADFDKGELPAFGKGDLFNLSASSPIKGWLYLFAIDASRVIVPVYPGEGAKSEIWISKNSRLDVSDKINECISKSSTQVKPEPLKFCGEKEGFERVLAMVVGTEQAIPVTVSHLRSRFPLSFLFAHLHKHKGMGYSPIDSDNDFSSLSLGKIAIGTVDYYYKG
ncbi:hypothetical protein P4B35_22655 [Pontiellaceae bacterium B12227]|nr:hypothetical protein [Pontiellaceae bacterium B12227]